MNKITIWVSESGEFWADFCKGKGCAHRDCVCYAEEGMARRATREEASAFLWRMESETEEAVAAINGGW